MKLFLFLLVVVCVHLTSGKMFLNQKLKRFEDFAQRKAFEDCYGSDIYKNIMLKYRKACHTCGHQGTPQEFNLISNPDKLVSALVSGIENHRHHSSNSHGSPTIVINGPSESLIEKVIKNALLKRLLNNLDLEHTHEHNHGDVTHTHVHSKEHQDDNEHTHEHTHGDITHTHTHSEGHHVEQENAKEIEDDDEHTHEHTHGDVTHTHTHVEGHHVEHEHDEQKQDQEGEVSKERSKRHVIGDNFVSGLKKKIEESKHMMESKMSNITCVLKEIGIVNDEGELSLEGIQNCVNDDVIDDAWAQKERLQVYENCYHETEAIPQSVLDSCSFGPKFYKYQHFGICCELGMMETCLLKDTKENLEENFGSLEDLKESSGLDDKTLLYTAYQLMNDRHHHDHDQ